MEKRSLDGRTRQRIVAAGRRTGDRKLTTGQIAEELRVDVHVVRRVLQVAGLRKANPDQKARAEKLVATWLERGQPR